MALSAWYLHKVIQCARLAEDAFSTSEMLRLISEREQWLQVLVEELGTDSATLEIAIALEAEWARGRRSF
jgi:hypothetical protein